ncbi:BatD family protein [Thiobacillus sedimenti]|uniref:BatD family protein n=1 Tax=Thiobacillus sedimenti TaxID=3110231 RepID=A0ABZ1CM28_9PROT|nr:BatD family protein [Thiobacillus sp. SCUT-2]WRS39372.1 BatD family protein [Thiobacillus sp. SCUT-2]
MNPPCRLLAVLSLWALSVTASAAVTAWLDRNQVPAGEAVQLTLRHDGETGRQPDLGPLRQDFEVLGRSTGSSIQINNGNLSAQTEIVLTLMPKRSGTLQVPSLRWDGQTTPALALAVGGNATGNAQGGAPAGAVQHVFLTTTLDQKQPYVQAAVRLTVRLYTDEPLYQASLELQPSNDVLVQQLGKDRQSQTTRDGLPFQVVERTYLLFPQRSGRIRLDGPVLNAAVQGANGNDPFGMNGVFGNVFGRNPFGNMMGATRPLRIAGDPIVLDVRPRPASGKGHDWLPAQKVTLTETWQPDQGPVRVGDPITRHLHLSALGLTASQLPDLSVIMPVPDGLRAYPDQAKLDTGVQGDGVVGTRDQDIALIASRSGRYTLPALRVSWWDTTRNLQREVVLPAHTLDVLPAAGGLSAATVPPSQNANMPPSAGASVSIQPPPAPADGARWRWLSLVLGVLWLGTLAAWRISRRRARNAAPAAPAAARAARGVATAEARKAFRQACDACDPQAARRALLAWARAAWPDAPPLGLQGLAQRLGDAELSGLLKELDRVCYAGGTWQGAALAEALKSLPEPDTTTPGTAPALAGLYP